MPHQKTFAGTPNAVHATIHGGETEGERLETQIWEDLKSCNWDVLEKKIAPEFQSIHNDGPRNRAGELALIKNLKLGHYILSHFKSSQQGDTIVVTYSVSADEMIDDRHLSGRTSNRMSVWKNNNGHWQWLAHANLSSLGK